MHTILHRVNTIALLEKTSSNLGIEVDIRSNGENLILHHDPFQKGELFEDWIKHYNHGTLILNVKEESDVYCILGWRQQKARVILCGSQKQIYFLLETLKK